LYLCSVAISKQKIKLQSNYAKVKLVTLNMLPEVFPQFHMILYRAMLELVTLRYLICSVATTTKLSNRFLNGLIFEFYIFDHAVKKENIIFLQ
jgi:hypothetical protein